MKPCGYDSVQFWPHLYIAWWFRFCKVDLLMPLLRIAYTGLDSVVISFSVENSPISLILLHARGWGSKIRLVFSTCTPRQNTAEMVQCIYEHQHSSTLKVPICEQFRTFWLYTPFSCYRIRVPKAQWEFSGGFSCQKQMAEWSFKVDSYTN